MDRRLASVSYGSGGKKRISSTFRHLGFRTFSSEEGNRREVPDMVIIFTDGLSTDRPQSKVSRLKRRNIRVAIVAVGEETNFELIDQIVTKPAENNVFRLGQVDRVIGAIRSQSIGSCPRDAVVNQTTATEAPQVIEPTEGGINCTSGYIVSVPGVTEQDTTSIMQCQADYQCAQLHSNVTVAGAFSGEIYSFQCLPPAGCRVLSCDLITSVLPDDIPFQLHQCEVSCCAENLCNSPGSIPSPAITARPSMTTATPSGGINCTSGYIVSVPGVTEQDTTSIMQCQADYQCAQLHSNVTVAGAFSGEIYSFQCLPPAGCRVLSCDLITSVLPDDIPFQLHQCEVSCCAENLCNSPGSTPSSATTTRPLITTTTPSGCGFTDTSVTTSPRNFTSLNFPSNYPTNVACVWTLIASPGMRIRISFTRFETEFCCDYFTIRENGLIVNRLRGNESLYEFTSSTNQVQLNFDSDETVTYAGFHAQYVAIAASQSSTMPSTTQAITSATSEIIFTPVPVTTTNIVESDNFAETAAYAMLSRLTSRIRIIIPSWYNYRYDRFSPFDYISDGGNDMYDDGNEVYFHGNQNVTRLTYNQSYRFGHDELTSAASHPFLALLWVENANRQRLNYTVQVKSNTGADGRGNISRIFGNVSEGSFIAQYHVLQVSGTTDPSICEVYFAISSTQEWSSSGPFTYNVIRFSSGTNDLDNSVELVGRPSRVMMGYTLLSKSRGLFITQREIDATLRELMIALNTETTVTPTEMNTATGFVSENFAEAAAHAVTSRLISRIRNIVSGWFNYRYDRLSPFNFINDGGGDMYDGGNRVFLHSNNNVTQLTYNQSYRFGHDEVTSAASHPFLALLWVENANREILNYTIQVKSNAGADGNGNINRMFGNVSEASFLAQYHVLQVSGAGDPSICEVYFVISSAQEWSSSGPFTYNFIQISSGTNDLDNSVELVGRPSRVMMGYTLLSKSRGRLIQRREIEATLREMMIALNTVTPPEQVSVSYTPDVTTETTVTTTELNTATSFISDNFAETVVRAISSRLMSRIRKIVSGWFNYNYDRFSPFNSIRDGGADMYDVGNLVFLHANNNVTQLTYNQSYSFGDAEVTSVASHPFLVSLWIHNANRERRNYTIQVTGNAGADGSGQTARLSGNLAVASFIARYHVFQVFGTSDPSICEVYFVISNAQEWHSFGSSSFNRVRVSSGTDNLDNSVELDGSFSRMMMGYMLLSKRINSRGVSLSRDEIEDTLREMMLALDTVTPPEQVSVPYTPEATTETTVTSTELNTATSFISEPPPTFVPQLLRAIQRRQFRLSTAYRNWYAYRYDGTNRSIADGGFDMFDGGNLISVRISGHESTNVVYNQIYAVGGLEFGSHAGNPFVGLFWINDNPTMRNVVIQVTGNPGSDSRGSTTTFSGAVSDENYYRLEYSVFQIFGAGDSTICELHFAIYNERLWGSRRSTRPDIRFSGDTNQLNTIVSFRIGRGNLQNVLLGYTLLSRYPSSEIQRNEIEIVASRILEIIHTISFGGTTVGFTTAETTEARTNVITPYTTNNVTTPPVFTTTPSVESAIFARTAAFAVSRRLNREIRDIIVDWSNYIYDGTFPFNSILDGGNDTYDGGNMVFVHVNNNSTGIIYNESYRYGDVEFTSVASHPFLTLLWVENANQERLNYTIQVRGNAGADGRGVISNQSGSVTFGPFTAYYHVFQVSQAGDPGICEVYFLITSTNPGWSSSRRSAFEVVKFSRDTNNLDNAVALVGRPRRVLMGYTLLSRYNGIVILRAEIQQTLRAMMRALDTVSPPPIPFTTPRPAPVDVDFLPSCTVRQAVNAIFRCEHLFARPNIFQGPATCRSEINEAIRCVGNQLAQCRMGGMVNVLDQFNFPLLNSKTMLTLLHNLTQDTEEQPNNAINTFCFHAPRNLFYPHNVANSLAFCEESVLNLLVQQSIRFYYSYTWARNRMDICRAFRTLKTWFTETAQNNCNPDVLYDFYSADATRYLSNAFEVAMNAANQLETTACADTTDDFFLDGFGTFGCLNNNN